MTDLYNEYLEHLIGVLSCTCDVCTLFRYSEYGSNDPIVEPEFPPYQVKIGRDTPLRRHTPYSDGFVDRLRSEGMVAVVVQGGISSKAVILVPMLGGSGVNKVIELFVQVWVPVILVQFKGVYND